MAEVLTVQFSTLREAVRLLFKSRFQAVQKAAVLQVLPAQQTLQDTSWYQGTADAVRQNLLFITAQNPEYTIILSGDQL